VGSIYQKGRDGYYYYQIYVFNPKTGKKNKRIFHSLKTRDKKEALEKKDFYDKKYNKNKKRKFLRIIFTIIIILFLSIFYHYYLTQMNKLEKGTDLQEIKLPNIVIDTLSEKKDTLISKNSSRDDLLLKVVNNIPDYKVLKSEYISHVFKQGEIHVLTSVNYKDQELLKLICRKVKSEFPEFLNFVIYLYTSIEKASNSEGEKDTINFENLKENYLVGLYMFNPLEGGYLDTEVNNYREK